MSADVESGKPAANRDTGGHGARRQPAADDQGSGAEAVRRIGRDYRAALTAWLARPLTSFHLVLAVFGLLTAFGLVMVLSASSVQSFAEDGSSFVVFHRQLLYCAAGLVFFWFGLRAPLRLVRRFSLAAMVLCVGLLVVVLSPLGSTYNGAKSWFSLGGLGSFQPSEIAKLALALWGAHVLVAKRPVLHRWRHLLIPVLPVALLMFGLVMLQPDLGTTITMAIVLLALLWFAGAPLALFAVVLGGAATGALALASLADYRSERIDAFLNPEMADPAGAGYQANQAAFSLADGGWFGAGLGQGRSKWMYLPNAHNDFIFAIVGEELGLIGCLVVLALFATLAYVGLRIAARNTDPWHRLLAATLTTWLVGQAAINIGYVVGLLPVTGLTLPLISSGGTSLVVTMLVFGLLANLARHEPQAVSALQAQGQGRVARLLGLPLPAPYRPPARRRTTQGRTGQARAAHTQPGHGQAPHARAATGRAATGRAVTGRVTHDQADHGRVARVGGPVATRGAAPTGAVSGRSAQSRATDGRTTQGRAAPARTTQSHAQGRAAGGRALPGRAGHGAGRDRVGLNSDTPRVDEHRTGQSWTSRRRDAEEASPVGRWSLDRRPRNDADSRGYGAGRADRGRGTDQGTARGSAQGADRVGRGVRGADRADDGTRGGTRGGARGDHAEGGRGTGSGARRWGRDATVHHEPRGADTPTTPTRRAAGKTDKTSRADGSGGRGTKGTTGGRGATDKNTDSDKQDRSGRW